MPVSKFESFTTLVPPQDLAAAEAMANAMRAPVPDGHVLVIRETIKKRGRGRPPTGFDKKAHDRKKSAERRKRLALAKLKAKQP